MVRISELTFLADSGILALALVTAYVSATIHYPANFSSVIQSIPYRLPYFGYSIWHLWGNLLDAPLSGGPDIDNFLLDAYCWYGRHYESRLHPLFLLPSISILPMDPSGRQTGWFCILHLKDLSVNDLSAV